MSFVWRSLHFFCKSYPLLFLFLRNVCYFEGLEEVASECKDLRIEFHLLFGQAVNVLPEFVQQHNMGAVVTDFAPLRVPLQWVKDIQAALPKDVPLCQVK